MARTVRDAKLDSRAARLKLAAQKPPYWSMIEQGRHVGYYKTASGGSWSARIRANGYKEKRLGTADDTLDANGTDILSFAQAQAAARAWFDELTRQGEAKGEGEAITVRTAVESYIKAMGAAESAREGRTVKARCASTLGRHVLGNEELAGTDLHTLTAARLAQWRAGIPGTASTQQRVTNDLKAALNEAATSPTLRQIIKDGLATPKRKLSTSESGPADSNLLDAKQTRDLLAAIRESDSDGDLYRFCLLLAATGARFAQLRRLKVADVQAKRSRIMVPASRKGRSGADERAAIPVPVGLDVLDALLPITKGRKASDPLLERWRHVQEKGTMAWVRDSRGPWQSAAEMARPFREAVKAAELGDAVSAYSFRHSSIVRALEQGLPTRLVAQLHDTSIAMIERNYTRFMADALEDLARKAIVPMVEQRAADNVVPIKGLA